MPRMNPTDIQYWLKEVASCERRKQKELKERNHYPDLIKYYEGDMDLDRDTLKDRQAVNKSRMSFINEYFPNVNALVAELIYKNPDITANPTKPSSEQDAPVMKAALGYAFDKLDALTENKVALFDMIFAGFGAVEVNHINTGVVKSVPKLGVRERIRGFFGAKGMEDAEERVAESVPGEEENYATEDETYLRRWNPLLVGFDYRAERMKDCRYVYKIIYKTPAEIGAMYPALKNKVLPTGGTLAYCEHENDAEKKLVTLYEIQLKQDDGKYVNFIISPGYKLHEIDYFERPYTTNGFNLKIGYFHEYGRLYPISMAQINKLVQDDINNYSTFMKEVAERNIPKRLYNKDAIKSDGLERLNNNVIMESVPAEGNLQNAVFPVLPANISNDNKEILAMLQGQKEKLWNVTAESLGQKGDAEFATEVQLQAAGFQSRSFDLQEGLRKMIKAELNTLKDIIVQFWDGEMWFKITDYPEPSWYEPKLDPITGRVLNPLAEMLTMDYEIDVDIRSSMRPNEEKEKSDIVELMGVLFQPGVFQYLNSQGLTINPEFIKGVAKRFKLNPETVFKELPPPTAEDMLQGQVSPESIQQAREQVQAEMGPVEGENAII